MRLVTVVLTVLSLAACYVEGPGAGEAKVKPKKNEPDMSNPLDGILWLEADAVQGLYSPLLMAWRVDHENNKFSIRPVKFNRDNFNHEVPGGADDCVDHYNITADDTDPSKITYEGSKGGIKSIKITIDLFGAKKGKARSIEYKVIDQDGDSVTYKKKRPLTSDERAELPLQHDLDNRVPFDEFFNDDHPDCDHVSQSGDNENGN